MNHFYKHEIRTCPRCGRVFECKLGNILECQCYGIQLSEKTIEEIRKKYISCLCRSCLESFEAK
jgi:hypothetical protein